MTRGGRGAQLPGQAVRPAAARIHCVVLTCKISRVDILLLPNSSIPPDRPRWRRSRQLLSPFVVVDVEFRDFITRYCPRFSNATHAPLHSHLEQGGRQPRRETGREGAEPQISRQRSLHPFFSSFSFLALVHLEVSLRTLRAFTSSSAAAALFVVGDPPGLGRHDGHLLPRAARRCRRRALLVAGVPALGLGEPVYLQSEEDVVRSRHGCTEPAIRPT